MKRLFICEKASLAQTVADGLTGSQHKSDGSIIVGDDVVTWSHGHILQLLEPQEYDEKYKKWDVDILPIIPEEWKYKITDTVTYKKISSLIKECRKSNGVIVNVGDADREGQLLIDEIFMNEGINLNTSGASILRLYITDPTVAGVKKSLAAMKQNSDPECRGSSNAAVTRSKADWIVGMSGTRLLSCTSKVTEHVGRVQLPTLALIVKRDLEIDNFVPKPFYVLKAWTETSSGKFVMQWYPTEDWNGLDDAGRIINRELLNEKTVQLKGTSGSITKFERKQVNKGQPLPHDLSTLQVEASKKYGYSAKQTLDILQKLYEKKLTTYPRSDCAYLPNSMYEEKDKILDGIFIQLDQLLSFKGLLQRGLKTKAWNDSKVAEHFGIIPTGSTGSMTDDETKIYLLVAKRFLAQFLPAQLFNTTEAEALISGEVFKTKTKKCVLEGWHALYKNDEDDEKPDEAETSAANLPELEKGQSCRIEDLKIEEKKTTPPERFTEGSIIQAMSNIYKYVNDPELKEQLKEEGIGTAATRAGIIENLKLRGDVELKKKVLISTEKARTRIAETPADLTSAGMTAIWEKGFKLIEQGKLSPDVFFKKLISWFLQVKAKRLKDHPVVSSSEKFAGHYNAAGKSGNSTKKFAPGAKKSGSGATGKETKCPYCKGRIIQLRSHAGKLFWKCQESNCGKAYNDKNGKPLADKNGQPKRDMTHSRNFKSLR